MFDPLEEYKLGGKHNTLKEKVLEGAIVVAVFAGLLGLMMLAMGV